MKTRWKKTLIFIAASLVLVVLLACATAVVFLYSYEFNRFKPYLERTVKETFGRQLTIAGDIRVKPGLPPGLSAEDLLLQNAAWASRPEMMTLARIEVAVRLLPLLQRHLVLSRVKLVQPDIRFEVGPSGAWNVAPASENAGSREPKNPPPVTIERLQIQSGSFQYRGSDTTQHTLVLKTFDLHRKVLSSNHEINLEGSFDEEPLHLSGTLTQMLEFIFAKAALAFDLTADARTTRVSADGRLQPQDAGFDLDSRVEVEGDTVLDVLRFFGIDAFPDFGPLQVNGKVSGSLTALAAEDIQLQAGGGGYPETRIEGRIGDLNRFRDVVLDFVCHDSQAASIEKVIGTALPLKGPFRVNGRFEVPAEDRYRFGDLQLSLGENHLRGELVLDGSATPLQMTASLAGPRIDARPLDISFPASPETYSDLGPLTFEITATAPFATLSAEKIKLQAGSPDRVELTLEGSIDNLPDLEGPMLAWRVRGNRLRELAALLGQTWPVSGKFENSGKLLSPSSNRYRLDEIKMTAAGSDLQGSFEMDLGGQQPVVAATLDSKVLDLSPFLDAGASDGRPARKSSASTEARWFPTAFQKMQVRIDYRAATLRTPDFTAPEISADMTLQGGKLLLAVSGPRLPDIVPEVKISQLGGFRGDLEISNVSDPSPAASFALKTDSPDIGLVQIQGTIAGLPALYPVQADFHLKFPDAAGLAALLGHPPRMQIQGPLSAEARLEIPSGNAYQWRRIDLRAGKSELSGDLLMVFSGVRPQIKADLRLPLLDLPALLAAGGNASKAKDTDSEKPADIRKIIAGAVQPWARALQAVD
ncbi:MAG TPA: AsmA family protein, partial [Desulfobacterales bacterium]